MLLKQCQSRAIYYQTVPCGYFSGSNISRLYRLLYWYMLIGGFCAASLLLFVIDSSKAHSAQSPKTVIDLQPSRTTHSIELNLADSSTAKVTLINLNPKVNQWYLLRLTRSDKKTSAEYHLENPYPKRQRVVLDEESSDKLLLTRDGETVSCAPWNLFGGKESVLQAAVKSRQVFSPLCNGKLYLRNPTRGHRTAIESVTEFLRDKMPGGEAVVGFVKKTFLKDAYHEDTRMIVDSAKQSTISVPGFPLPADVNPAYADKLIIPAELGIQVENKDSSMLTGRWYGVKNNPGIFVSLIQPKAVSADILKSYSKLTRRFDSIEARALSYLIAYDLDHFELGFTVGAHHPRVGWSPRTRAKMKVPGLPGPDGIGTISPLVPNGMINPVKAARTVSTFTGGFKRSHGAFKYGNLAQKNRGTHYGFIENGVVLSSLQPGLATLLMLTDGKVEMKTWSQEDNNHIDQIIHARQNGVPIVEWDSDMQKSKPGSLVAHWGRGNWSGSVNMKLRTLRAGIALQQTYCKRFLIYGYFSTATPSAMARVFQAYSCRYGMHLDMNALEHTYLALYHKEDQQMQVQHLIRGMSVLDKSKKKVYIPRFLGYADNRDFFYVMKRREWSQTVD